MALKLRHHDRKTHLRRVPRGETARAIFEAVEQVRVEALGARRMAGVADNLAALWRQRSDQRGLCPHQVQGRRADRRGDRPDRPRAAAGRVAAGGRQGDGRHVARRCRVRCRPRLPEAARIARPTRNLRAGRAPAASATSSSAMNRPTCRTRTTRNRRTRRTPTASRTRPATTRAIRARPTATAPRARRARTHRTGRRLRDRRRPGPDRDADGLGRRGGAGPRRASVAAAGCAVQRAAGPAVSRLHGEVRRDRRGRRAVRRRGARPPAQPARPAAQRICRA